MADPQDSLEIGGRRLTPAPDAAASGPRRRFLSIWFRCCHVYGRLYRNAEATRYEGRCPRCGSRVQARIGANGSSRRIFEAR